MQSFYVIYYFKVEPYVLRSAMRLVVFNEVMIMISCYHLFTFSKAVNSKFNYYAGYSYAITIGFLVAVNLAVMVWK